MTTHDAEVTAPAPKPGWVDARGADRRALRDLFGTYLTGVTIVTMRDETGAPKGFTANSFTSVSLEPPIILICVGQQASSHDVLCRSTHFGVNILGDWQREASAAFSTRSGRKFDVVETLSRGEGPPLIRSSLSAMECQTEQVVTAGDHSIVIGRVLGFHRTAGQPLGYCAGSYVAFGLGAEALERLGGEAIQIGCLVESRDRLLLLRKPHSAVWELPAAALRAGEDHRQLLPRLWKRLGVTVEISFLYSVYQDPGEAYTTMLFRGTAEPLSKSRTFADGTELRLFAEAELPFEALRGPSQIAVIRRYLRERSQARFGIYWDTNDGGRVAALQSTPARWRSENSSPTLPQNEDH